jgi:hypothetical protein
VGGISESITGKWLAAPYPRVPAIGLLAILFLGVAFWNGFPLMFYDTGGYMAQGLHGVLLVERSPVYSLLLPLTGAWLSMWLVIVVQALLTAFIVTELARAEAPRLSLLGLLAIGLCLTLVTGIGWYVGQIEPDCFTALVLLGSYLLLFRSAGMTKTSRLATIAITGLSVACHPSHLGLMGGLLICAAMMRAAHRYLPGVIVPRLWPCLAALGFAFILLVAANFGLSGRLYVSRAGPVFVFARLMQDGIVQRLLDDTCPQSGYRLCAYRGHLPHNANSWLWGENSAFHAMGGFGNSGDEDGRIIRDSLIRYPVMHVKAAVYESVLQFFEFKTGDGIESQQWVLTPAFRGTLPRQLSSYLAARQQSEPIRFKELNLLHVTVGALAILSMLLLLHRATVRGRWSEATLPGMILVGLIGNAIICGTFSNPHDRYQSRLIWTPVLVVLLARARDPRVLQPLAYKDA